MSEERFDILIKVTDANGITTQIEHSGCPESALIQAPLVGSLIEEHKRLRAQGIRHLEVTL